MAAPRATPLKPGEDKERLWGILERYYDHWMKDCNGRLPSEKKHKDEHIEKKRKAAFGELNSWLITTKVGTKAYKWSTIKSQWALFRQQKFGILGANAEISHDFAVQSLTTRLASVGGVDAVADAAMKCLPSLCENHPMAVLVTALATSGPLCGDGLKEYCAWWCEHCLQPLLTRADTFKVSTQNSCAMDFESGRFLREMEEVLCVVDGSARSASITVPPPPAALSSLRRAKEAFDGAPGSTQCKRDLRAFIRAVLTATHRALFSLLHNNISRGLPKDFVPPTDHGAVQQVLYYLTGYLMLKLELNTTYRRGRSPRVSNQSLQRLAKVILPANELSSEDTAWEQLPKERVCARMNSHGVAYFPSLEMYHLVCRVEQCFRATLTVDMDGVFFQRVVDAVLDDEVTMSLWRAVVNRAVDTFHGTEEAVALLRRDIEDQQTMQSLLREFLRPYANLRAKEFTRQVMGVLVSMSSSTVSFRGMLSTSGTVQKVKSWASTDVFEDAILSASASEKTLTFTVLIDRDSASVDDRQLSRGVTLELVVLPQTASPKCGLLVRWEDLHVGHVDESVARVLIPILRRGEARVSTVVNDARDGTQAVVTLVIPGEFWPMPQLTNAVQVIPETQAPASPTPQKRPRAEAPEDEESFVDELLDDIDLRLLDDRMEDEDGSEDSS